MPPLAHDLPPHRIQLGVRAACLEEAVGRALESLRGAPGVRDFAAMAAAVTARPAAVAGEEGHQIAIAHGRTECVDRLLLAAVRVEPPPAAAAFPRLIFVAAIPSSYNAEYLRAVGAIARACSTPQGYESLMRAPTPSAFSSLLEEAEHALK